MLKVAVFNLKGGTCKSTTVLNLGAALALSKYKTLLIDLDGQRTLSFGLGFDGKTPTALDWLQEDANPISLHKNLFLIPGDIEMFRLQGDTALFAKAFNKLSGIDVVLMDCPPSLSFVSAQAILASDRVLMPTLCEPAALKGLSEAVPIIRADRGDIPIDVLRTRYKSRLLLTQKADELLIGSADELGYHLLYTNIPENIVAAEAIASQKSLLDYAPKSPATKAYQSLAKECQKLWRLK